MGFERCARRPADFHPGLGFRSGLGRWWGSSPARNRGGFSGRVVAAGRMANGRRADGESHLNARRRGEEFQTRRRGGHGEARRGGWAQRGAAATRRRRLRHEEHEVGRRTTKRLILVWVFRGGRAREEEEKDAVWGRRAAIRGQPGRCRGYMGGREGADWVSSGARRGPRISIRGSVFVRGSVCSGGCSEVGGG